MTLTEFQQDLRDGMTIHDALVKHELTFNEAVRYLHGYVKPKQKRNTRRKTGTGEKYITYNQGKYLIKRRVNGKEQYFGRYNTLEDAVKMREYCEEHGWYKHRVKGYREVLGI